MDLRILFGLLYIFLLKTKLSACRGGQGIAFKREERSWCDWPQLLSTYNLWDYGFLLAPPCFQVCHVHPAICLWHIADPTAICTLCFYAWKGWSNAKEQNTAARDCHPPASPHVCLYNHNEGWRMMIKNY